MATNIINTIAALIDEIRDTYAITQITNSGALYTIKTADTKRLVVGDWIKISGNDYKIVQLTTNVQFQVNSTIQIIGNTWKALAPYFFYGTAIMVSNVIDKLKDNQNKFPAIVLFETMPAVVNNDFNNPIERTVSLEMYFVDEANYRDWDSEEYYTQVIDKLQLYVDAFIEKCYYSTVVSTPTTHTETPYSKWNMVRLDVGKNVFNAELSGIGVNIDLDIYYKPECSDE